MLKCSLCIHDERTAKIKIVNGKPLCKECPHYLTHKPDKEKISAELEELMGKVNKAIENAKRICGYLDVPLTVLRYEYSDIFREALLKAKSPCKKCSSRTMEKLRKYALKKGVKYIITGHELPFGHHPYGIMRDEMIQIRLLSLMSEEERFKILEKLPFKFPELAGYTTNCLVLGPALDRYYKKHGYSFEMRRIAALVRFGLLDEEKAMKKVSKPEIPEEVEREIVRKLGLREKLNMIQV